MAPVLMTSLLLAAVSASEEETSSLVQLKRIEARRGKVQQQDDRVEDSLLSAPDPLKPGKKCPFEHGDRVFKKSNVKTWEKCKEECEKRDGCKYFSYQEKNARKSIPDAQDRNDKVCMGCKDAKNAQGHPGFNLYEVPETTTTTTNHEDLAKRGKKCPHEHKDRLFKTTDVSFNGCQKKCQDTPGCKFFSYQRKGASKRIAGAEERNDKVCMGCTTAQNAQEHDGFNLYEVPETTTTTTNHEALAKRGKKCPHNHKDRLFRKSDVKTLEKCQQECEKEKGCKYYSYQRKGASKRIAGAEDKNDFVCMGCSTAKNAEKHSGFHLYKLPKAEKHEDLVKGGKKCPHNHKDRVFKAENVKSLEACEKKCEKTERCKFYSYQFPDASETVPGAEKRNDGACMGCTRAKHAQKHDGFNLYKLPEEPEALEPEEPEAPMCCQAMTVECMACAAGVPVAEYCKQNPESPVCPQMIFECKDGEIDDSDPCVHKVCDGGRWMVAMMDCAMLMCPGGAKPIQKEGQCCPVCPETCKDGEIDDSDPCTHKECANGQWMIAQVACALPICAGGADPIFKEGQCCPSCPDAPKAECEEGMADNSNPCAPKVCGAGRWIVQMIRCAAPECGEGVTPFRPEGECCERCPEIIEEPKAECEGDETDNSNPCEPKTCEDGHWLTMMVDCFQEPDCGEGVEPIQLDGQCCKSCPEEIDAPVPPEPIQAPGYQPYGEFQPEES